MFCNVVILIVCYSLFERYNTAVRTPSNSTSQLVRLSTPQHAAWPKRGRPHHVPDQAGVG